MAMPNGYKCSIMYVHTTKICIIISVVIACATQEFCIVYTPLHYSYASRCRALIELQLVMMIYYTEALISIPILGSKYDFISKKWPYFPWQYCWRKIKTGYDFNYPELLPC